MKPFSILEFLHDNPFGAFGEHALQSPARSGERALQSYALITESGSMVAALQEGTIVATVYGTTVRKNKVAI